MTHRSLPELPRGYRVTSHVTVGEKRRWQASADEGSWIGPTRKSERSAVHDARKHSDERTAAG